MKMKEIYEKPELITLRLTMTDVIVTSDNELPDLEEEGE